MYQSNFANIPKIVFPPNIDFLGDNKWLKTFDDCGNGFFVRSYHSNKLSRHENILQYYYIFKLNHVWPP